MISGGFILKIIVDTLGGDNSPWANIEGAIIELIKHRDLSVIFTGDETRIGEVLEETFEKVMASINKYDKNPALIDNLKSRIEIVHAPDIITGNDKPTDAIRLKKDSSMMRSIKLLREDESISAMVSNGATGALVAAATLRIPRIDGVRRPAFCPVLPTMKSGVIGVCDSGANVDIKADLLQQFAIMGSKYLEAAFGIESPRVGLLNIGVEEEKGDDLRREAYKLLKETPEINFVGNMEARELLSGDFDLVVCDGFSGNVLVKSVEGTALELLKKIKDDIYSKKKYQVGALFMKQMFNEEKEFLNYQRYGGSVMLGSEKVIVKGHGSSDKVAVAKCIEQAYKMVEGNLNKKIAEAISGAQTE